MSQHHVERPPSGLRRARFTRYGLFGDGGFGRVKDRSRRVMREEFQLRY